MKLFTAAFVSFQSSCAVCPCAAQSIALLPGALGSKEKLPDGRLQSE